jgi:hypothetical protein
VATSERISSSFSVGNEAVLIASLKFAKAFWRPPSIAQGGAILGNVPDDRMHGMELLVVIFVSPCDD